LDIHVLSAFGSLGYFVPSQLRRGLEPILLRRTLRTAACYPEFVSQFRDLGVPEQLEAMFVGRVLMRFLCVLNSPAGVFQGFSRKLLSGLVILFAVLLRGSAVRVRRFIV
jgi:hypothetical protein